MKAKSRRAWNRGYKRTSVLGGYDYYTGSRLTAPIIFLITIVLGIFSLSYGQFSEMIRTWHEVSKVDAYEKPVVVVPKDAQMTEKQQIMNYIIEVFEDKAMEALKIAECESGFNPNTVGDTHLMSINNQTGELIGGSLGIFQIRTGDTTWNRAKANGLTADEFRSKLRDFRYNIDYAKTIYDNAGSWSPWFNCMNKVGLN